MADKKREKYQGVRRNRKSAEEKIEWSDKIRQRGRRMQGDVDKGQSKEEGKIWEFGVKHYGDYHKLLAGRRELKTQQAVMLKREQEMERREQGVEKREQESKRREEASRKQTEEDRLEKDTILRMEERVKRRLQRGGRDRGGEQGGGATGGGVLHGEGGQASGDGQEAGDTGEGAGQDVGEAGQEGKEIGCEFEGGGSKQETDDRDEEHVAVASKESGRGKEWARDEQESPPPWR